MGRRTAVLAALLVVAAPGVPQAEPGYRIDHVFGALSVFQAERDDDVATSVVLYLSEP